MKTVIQIKNLLSTVVLISVLMACAIGNNGMAQGTFEMNVFDIGGPSPTCAGSFQNYFIYQIRLDQITTFAGCSGYTAQYVYTITNGVMKHPNTGANVTTFTLSEAVNVQARWTANGTITLVSRYTFNCGSGPLTTTVETRSVSVTLSTPPSINGTFGWGPVPGDRWCSNSEASITLTLPDNGPYLYDVEWSYFVSGPNTSPSRFVSVGSHDNVPSGTITLEFTVPDYTSIDPANQRISVVAQVMYASCHSVSTGLLFSNPIAILPASPSVNVNPFTAICDALGRVTVSGSCGYPYALVTFISADTVFAGAPSQYVAVNQSTDTYSATFNNIPVRTSDGNLISWRVQVENWETTAIKATCGSTIERTFTFPTATPTVTFTQSPTVQHEACYDPLNHTGIITIQPNLSGLRTPLTYEIFDGSSTTAVTSSATSMTFTNRKGDYSHRLRVRDANNCKTNPEDIFVQVNEPDDITITLDSVKSVSCKLASQGPSADGYIEVSAVGGTGEGFTYSIDSNQDADYLDNNGAFSNVARGEHIIRVKDKDGGCVKEFPGNPVNVAEPDESVSATNIVKLDPVCFDSLGTFGLEGSGGTGSLTYYLNGTNMGATNSFRLAAGSHTIRIRDENGCRIDVTRTLIAPADITISSLQTTIQSCPEIVDGAIRITATGGTGTRQYSLDNATFKAEGSPTLFSNLTTGNYNAYIKDANGCLHIEPVFVDIQDELGGIISVDHPISCYGDSDGVLSIAGTQGNPGYTYLWSTGTAGAINAGLDSGYYWVEITDAKLCKDTVDFVLTHPGFFYLTDSLSAHNGYEITCKDADDGAIFITPYGGTAPFTYAWTGTDGYTSIAEDPSGLPPGTYTVIATDDHDCVNSISDILITEPAQLIVSLVSKKDIRCYENEDGAIKASIAGGVSGVNDVAGAYEYSLDSADWILSGSAWEFLGQRSGDYIVYVRDKNLCVDTMAVTLTQPDELILSLVDTTNTECGYANGAASVKAEGGVPVYDFVWHDDTTLNIATGTNIASAAAGDYLVVVRDRHDCFDSLEVFIENSNGPQIAVLNSEPPRCHDTDDGIIEIGITQGVSPYTIQWRHNGQVVPSYTSELVHELPGGNYTARVSDADGCMDFETISIPAPLPLSVAETVVQPACVGASDGSIDLTVSGGNGGYVYLWTHGATGPSVTSLPTGIYMVTIQDAKLCSLSHSITLSDPPPTTIDIGEDRTICVGQQVRMAPGLAGEYVWTSDNGFSSTSSEITVGEEGLYHVVYTSLAGCVAEDEMRIVTSTDLLQADFLMVSEAHAGDTVLIIDISWPLPDNIGWEFPEGVTTLSSDGPLAEVIFNDPGEYTVTLNASIGECIDDLVKAISILEARPDFGERKSSQGDFIRNLSISPNPNNGRFGVTVELMEKSDVYAAVVTQDGSRIVYSLSDRGESNYQWDITLPAVSSGLYYLIVKAGDKVKVARIVKM